MNHEQMQMEFVRKLPIPQEIKKQFPISEKSPNIKPNVTKPFAVFLQANPTRFS